MKRCEMIKEKEYFSSIIKHGKFTKDNLFVVYFVKKEKDTFSHFGIAIRHDIGKAVVRNKLKRQVRSIIDNNKKLFKKGTDYIIMIRNKCRDSRYVDMDESIKRLLKGINE